MIRATLDWLDWLLVPRDYVVVTIAGLGTCTMDPVTACSCVAEFQGELDVVTVAHSRMTACKFESMVETNGW